MNDSNIIDIEERATAQHNNVGVRSVDYRAGETRGDVSSQWFNRPDDQKFTDLSSLSDMVKARYDASSSHVVATSEIEVIASPDSPDGLAVHHAEFSENGQLQPTHWSFGQMCQRVKAPPAYLRTLPAVMAGMNLQYGLSEVRSERLGFYEANGELRATTGADYGRVYDYEVVEAVRKIAGNGVGDTNWKVPGVMNWRDGTYNPDAPITRDSTTLFASDRDIFLFLVDDRNPIEIGKLPSGEPDLMFRGFYVWNSEVGSASLGIATMYLRGVCQNRCLWGVEGYSQIKIRHSKNAPDRFITQARPTLDQFTSNNQRAVIDGVTAARNARVADDNDGALEFLQSAKGGKFPKGKAGQIINRIMDEEGVKPRSIWDMVQGITAVARDEGHQDQRVQMERIAGRLLDKVA